MDNVEVAPTAHSTISQLSVYLSIFLAVRRRVPVSNIADKRTVSDDMKVIYTTQVVSAAEWWYVANDESLSFISSRFIALLSHTTFCIQICKYHPFSAISYQPVLTGANEGATETLAMQKHSRPFVNYGPHLRSPFLAFALWLQPNSTVGSGTRCSWRATID